MKKAASSAAIYLILVASVATPAALIAWQSANAIDYWERLAVYHEARHDYYFAGLIARGMLDICTNAKGEKGIFFKEDCR